MIVLLHTAVYIDDICIKGLLIMLQVLCLICEAREHTRTNASP